MNYLRKNIINNQKKRLFTFGCSHTCYRWPTWADMISLEYSEHYNFGQAGSDNFSILNKIIRAIDYFNITQDDTILIMLTSWDRIDYYTEGYGWKGIGGITGDGIEEIYGRKFIENHMDNFDYEIERTYTYLQSIIKILDSINCKYKIKNAFVFGSNPQGIKILQKTSTKNTIKQIKKLCGGFDSLYKADEDNTHRTYSFETINQELKPDGHLDIKTHLDFCKKHFSELYNDKWDDIILECENHITRNSDDVTKFFKPIRYFFINNICFHHYWPSDELVPEGKPLIKNTI